jgi:hypothetical protein
MNVVIGIVIGAMLGALGFYFAMIRAFTKNRHD